MNGSRHLVRLCALAALALCTSPARAEDAAPRQADRAQLQIAPNAAVAWDEGPAEAPKGERPPNIVLILADDLGFNDIAFYGGGVAGGRVPTPNIDSIARDGAHFTNGYSGHANCAPSRAALMTGRYPTRFGFAFTPTPLGFARSLGSVVTQGRRKVYRADLEDAVPPVEEMGLPTDETTLAELLAARGYHTVQLGKWHLGESPRFLPERQGFDEWLGFPAGASLFLPKDDPRAVNSVQPYDPIDVYLWDHLQYFVRKDGGAPFRPDTHMTDYLSDEAVRVIAANRNRPFFLYLAYNAPHTPLQALKEDYDALGGIEDHTLRVYAAMIR
ncbi:MAG: sulfatase-like hydrolase/transferase, partial [Alphaproteobacteria bacterium]|nr:sulfatase-like hydrolase/transferase [Alphaproteobacteria bacterium]